jgi:hypothetical protein
MDIFNTFGTDAALEAEGVVHFLAGKDPEKDPWIRVARTGNPAYQEMILKLYEDNAEALQRGGKEARALSDQLMLDTMARTILTDWGNITFRGAPVPKGPAGAAMLLSVKDFADMVQKKADKAEHYRVKQVKEDAGNSQPA